MTATVLMARCEAKDIDALSKSAEGNAPDAELLAVRDSLVSNADIVRGHIEVLERIATQEDRARGAAEPPASTSSGATPGEAAQARKNEDKGKGPSPAELQPEPVITVLQTQHQAGPSNAHTAERGPKQRLGQQALDEVCMELIDAIGELRRNADAAGSVPRPLTQEEQVAVQFAVERMFEMPLAGNTSLNPQELQRYASAAGARGGPAELGRSFADQLLNVSSVGFNSVLESGLSAAQHNVARAGNALLSFCNGVAENNFTSTAAQIGASVANVSWRNVGAVLVPTVGRVFVQTAIDAALDAMGASQNVRLALAVGANAIPVVQQAMGYARDQAHGTATPTSQRSRLIMGGLGAASTIAAAARGNLAQNAANFLGIEFYTLCRDVLVQSRVRMNNRNTDGHDPTNGHWAFISTAYGLDQMLVDWGMSAWAARPEMPGTDAVFPSGNLLSDNVLHTAARALIRGGLNLAGEIAEDLMFQSYPAVASLFENGRSTHALNLAVRVTGPEERAQEPHAVNAWLGGQTVRQGIITMGVNAVNVLEGLFNQAQVDLSPMQAQAVSAAVVGIINCVLYHPFAMAQGGQPSGADIEAVRAAGDARREIRNQAREQARAAADAFADPRTRPATVRPNTPPDVEQGRGVPATGHNPHPASSLYNRGARRPAALPTEWPSSAGSTRGSVPPSIGSSAAHSSSDSVVVQPDPDSPRASVASLSNVGSLVIEPPTAQDDDSAESLGREGGPNLAVSEAQTGEGRAGVQNSVSPDHRAGRLSEHAVS